MACLCGSPQCPAGGAETSSAVVVHVLAETGTVEGASAKPGYVSGYGAMPAETVQQLATRARVRPVVIPKGDVAAEPQYRPSAGLSRFVRNRDLTCRWMGCDKPVWTADIDHSVPYPLGPTHPSNNVCYCRLHHLLKTFCSGPGGWRELQLPNGTMIFTSPSNRVYRSEPFGAMLFPQLGVPTGELDPGQRATTGSAPRAGHAQAKTHPRPRARLPHPTRTEHQRGPLRRRPATVLSPH